MMENHKHIFRDSLRWLRARLYCLIHGNEFEFKAINITLPADYAFYARKLFRENRYEKDEADFIEKYLAKDKPVVELGGSLGVVGAYIRSVLDPETEHVVVEANPNIFEVCRNNIAQYDALKRTHYVQAAIHYGDETVSFHVSKNVHANSTQLQASKKIGPLTSVKAITLADCLCMLQTTTEPSLVADIEGAEFHIFANDQEALKKFALIIVEIHPEVFAEFGASEAEFMQLVEQADLRLVERRKNVLVLMPMKLCA
jgi:FkbM family methyltransferase